MGRRFLISSLACLVMEEITSHHPYRVSKDAGNDDFQPHLSLKRHAFLHALEYTTPYDRFETYFPYHFKHRDRSTADLCESDYLYNSAESAQSAVHRIRVLLVHARLCTCCTTLGLDKSN